MRRKVKLGAAKFERSLRSSEDLDITKGFGILCVAAKLLAVSLLLAALRFRSTTPSMTIKCDITFLRSL